MASVKLRQELAGKKVVLQFSGANASASEIKEASKLSCFYDGVIMWNFTISAFAIPKVIRIFLI